MRRRDAQSRCPELSVQPVDHDRDARLFEPIAAAVEEITPGIEVLRPGMIACAARGPVRYFGSEERAAEHIVDAVEALDVECVIGVADVLPVAVLAARQSVMVPPGGDAAFCAALPITELAREPAIAPAERADLVDLLIRLGITTAGAFAALPAERVATRFGADAIEMHRLAAGLGQRGVSRRDLPTELGIEEICDPPLDRVDAAAFLARALAERFHAQLTDAGLACTRLAISARTERGKHLTRTWRCARPLTAAATADRLRWQLDGWLTAGRRLRPAGSDPSARSRGGRSRNDGPRNDGTRRHHLPPAGTGGGDRIRTGAVRTVGVRRGGRHQGELGIRQGSGPARSGSCSFAGDLGWSRAGRPHHAGVLGRRTGAGTRSGCTVARSASRTDTEPIDRPRRQPGAVGGPPRRAGHGDRPWPALGAAGDGDPHPDRRSAGAGLGRTVDPRRAVVGTAGAEIGARTAHRQVSSWRPAGGSAAHRDRRTCPRPSSTVELSGTSTPARTTSENNSQQGVHTATAPGPDAGAAGRGTGSAGLFRRGGLAGGRGVRLMSWSNPPVPWNELERALSGRKPLPGRGPVQSGRGSTHEEQPAGRWRRPPGRWSDALGAGSRPGSPACRSSATSATRVPYAELHCHSAFSFLDGASTPEAMVAEAVALGLDALATDRPRRLLRRGQVRRSCRRHRPAYVVRRRALARSPGSPAGDPGSGGGAPAGAGPRPGGLPPAVPRDQPGPVGRQREGPPDL